MEDKAFLAFSLGPVQPFIEAARTVRDLWSGSYLLAWLTFQAMKPILDGPGVEAMVSPDVTEHPLRRWKPGSRPTDTQKLLQPCLPNRFLAEVPADEASRLADACVSACRDAWKAIADRVRRHLWETGLRHETYAPGEKTLWQRQVWSFFEVRTAVLPWKEAAGDKLEKLLGESGLSGKIAEDLWTPRWHATGKLLQARRTVRHFPAYDPGYGPDDKVAQKCTLLGTYEHVGPADRQRAREFWEQAVKDWARRGTRTGPRERLCAVSLAKRFAWPDYFSADDVFALDPRELRFEDTATVAAALWLKGGEEVRAPKLQPNAVRNWSGQWLHWSSPKQDPDEDAVPEQKGFDPEVGSVWDVIQLKRRKQGRPPIYYAILMMDGDRMGDHLLRSAGKERHQALSSALAHFALDVTPGIVDGHAGELIYAGGDDVLALLPTETALACAADLNAAFANNWADRFSRETSATVSAGLAVVHYKEDLRFALRQARDAEKAAKKGGRDALQIIVCRRSGEHSKALCPWDFVGRVGGWVKGFSGGASDRWAYRLKAEMDTLRGVAPEIMRSELKRQLARGEERTTTAFPPEVMAQAFDAFRQAKKRKADGSAEDRFADGGEAFEHFVTLCQAASFLARGREA
jgi:CRISPR-associated protein Cmr2